jgi:hypothetical protein
MTGQSGYRDAVLLFLDCNSCLQAARMAAIRLGLPMMFITPCEVIGENMQRHLSGDIP